MALKINSIFAEPQDQWMLSLMGEVDVSTAPQLRAALDQAFTQEPVDVILDVANLGYMDSTGLGVIIGAYGRMQEKGRGITIINPKGSIKKLLHITSLDKIFLQDRK